jgi:S-adenosylmethionine decarboxylase
MKAQMHNFSTWVDETDPVILKGWLEKALPFAGFSVISFTEHHFEPQGWTCLWLLSESHLAVHTFPEENQTYIELSSCVKGPFDKFVKHAI